MEWDGVFYLFSHEYSGLVVPLHDRLLDAVPYYLCHKNDLDLLVSSVLCS